jgi:hypothetical protein
MLFFFVPIRDVAELRGCSSWRGGPHPRRDSEESVYALINHALACGTLDASLQPYVGIC